MIDVFELARTNGAVEGRIPCKEMTRLGPALRDVSGAVEYRFEGRIDEQGRETGVLRLRAQLPLTCDRCGQLVSVGLDRTAAFRFVTEEAELAALPVSVDDEPEPVLGSRQFDVASLVEDETILSIPLSPRHAECPAKDVERDASSRDGAPKPFAALPGLLRKNGR